MKNLPFFILFLLLVACFGYFLSMDFAMSIIPGWHTTFYPPYYIASVMLSFLFFIDLLFFWIATYRKSVRAKKIIGIHLLLSSLLALFIAYPQGLVMPVDESQLLLLADKVMISFTLFIVLQLMYFIFITIILWRKIPR